MKLIILVLTCWFIYNKLSAPQSLEKIKAFFGQPFSPRTVWLLSATGLLMVVNWGAEVFKWKFLVRKIEKVSLWKSTESLLAGLTLAIFTPNRIGEYGGRILYLERGNRVKGVFAMGVGAFSQMLVTNVIGGAAFFVFATRFIALNRTLEIALGIGILVFCVLFILFYFNVRWLYIILLSFRFLRKFRRFFKVLLLYGKKELLISLLYSLLRYLVFTTQHFLLIHLFLPSVDYADAMMLISVILMVQSIIPTMAMLDDLGVRGATSAYFFAFVVPESDASFVLASAFGVWLVNIILPAIAGLFFVFKANFFGGNGGNNH
ncbi:MAG TPA: lysylphosphatidylglycerol synthase domain-containing protein [Anseongella sp.]|nr:lysylphosphatidylglycerol synthase domain-containing protein [Anseongella sp.]